jgi:hypothetical protein
MSIRKMLFKMGWIRFDENQTGCFLSAAGGPAAQQDASD